MILGMKRVKCAGLALIALGVLASSVAATPAQVPVPVVVSEVEEVEALRQGFVGTVSELDDSSVTIEARDEEVGTVTFIIAESTEVRTPGAESVQGTFEQGASVAILAEETAENEWTAVQILVQPTGPSIRPVSGAVVSKENGVLTIALPDGTTREITLGPEAEIPEDGEIVTAIVDERGEKPTVTGVAKADEVRQRLERFITDEEARSDQDETARLDVIARLAGLLEPHATRNVEILERVLDNDKIPEAARTRITSAFERANTARENAAGIVDRLSQRFDRVRDILAERGGRPEGTSRPDSGSRPDATREAAGGRAGATHVPAGGAPETVPTRPTGGR